MELSPGRQRLLFVVVVIALAGLGIFVIQGRNHENAAAPAASPTPSASGHERGRHERGGDRDADRRAVGRRLARRRRPRPPRPAARTSTSGCRSPSPTSAAAAKTTLAFANVYANTSYTETKAAYAGKLAGLTTPQEAATLVSDFETSGISDHQDRRQAGRDRDPDDRLDQLVRPGAAGAAGPAVDHVRGHHRPEARLDLGHDHQHTGVRHHDRLHRDRLAGREHPARLAG